MYECSFPFLYFTLARIHFFAYLSCQLWSKEKSLGLDTDWDKKKDRLLTMEKLRSNRCCVEETAFDYVSVCWKVAIV